ncbi:DNA replication licensing factor MCM2 [Enteropsectra breve]|nr:DNA replication licensing factor MCM2 [Enteropsectra breve]
MYRRTPAGNRDESSVESIQSSDIDGLEASSFLQDDDMSSASEELAEEDRIKYAQTLPTHIGQGSELRESLCSILVEKISAKEKYVKAIREMCSTNNESIEISYSDIQMYPSVSTEPAVFCEVLDAAITKITLRYFPNYSMIKKAIHGRIVDLPVTESLRELKNVHLNKFVRVRGIVTRRSAIFSMYSLLKYTCLKCNATFGPFSGKDLKPQTCFACQGRGPFVVNVYETTYKDFQKLTIQEIPGTIPAGSLPRSKDVLMFDDLIDRCKPSDEVDITGIYKNGYSVSLNIKNGFPVFSTLIECSSVKISSSDSSSSALLGLTDDDIKEIREISKSPDVLEILLNSFAPSIYGHEDVKKAILVAMVGGECKIKESMRIRGDINVLLMGDPGTAKSQFLRYVQELSGRAILATGQGSSSVGLTASVRRDPALKEWVLEGGALVLADNGICLIDEFDKMGENDRVAIHEAMEQQSISISKAGIVASLHARCSVIAAANPIRGKYNQSLSFSQNINLSDPIVSRFDVLCVIKDEIDTINDKTMAEFILGNMQSNDESHKKSTSGRTISQELLRKYLFYAKNNIHPLMTEIDFKKISKLYTDLRKESLNSGVPITVRHVESIIRISEGFAKLRLRNYVAKEDIECAIRLTLDSFFSAQKFSVAKHLRKKLSKYLDENTNDLVVYMLKSMVSEKSETLGNNNVSKKELVARCKMSGISVPNAFFESAELQAAGFRFMNENIVRVTRE